jgi:hypothetical protein
MTPPDVQPHPALEGNVNQLSSEEIKQFELQLQQQRQAVLCALRQRLHQDDYPDELLTRPIVQRTRGAG